MIAASHSVLSSALQGRSLSLMTENILTEIYLMEARDVPATDLLEITQALPNVSTRQGGNKWNGMGAGCLLAVLIFEYHESFMQFHSHEVFLSIRIIILYLSL